MLGSASSGASSGPISFHRDRRKPWTESPSASARLLDSAVIHGLRDRATVAFRVNNVLGADAYA
jgi:hypothetical protein